MRVGPHQPRPVLGDRIQAHQRRLIEQKKREEKVEEH